MGLILASGSPRRRELLALITPNFTVQTSAVDESAVTAPTPAQLACALARAKCLAVAAQNPDDVVLGSDTVVEYAGQVFGKPQDRADARRMLTALSGTTHRVHTGVCLAGQRREDSFVVTTLVRFENIDPAEIEAYIATDEPYDKAGAYAIQGRAACWCGGIEGCYYNIMGLPVSRVAQALRSFQF